VLRSRRSRVLGLRSGNAGLSRSSRVLRSRRSRVLGLRSRNAGLSRRSRVDGLGRHLRLRDDNNRGLAGVDRLGRVNGSGVDGRVDGLALSVRALLVAVAVLSALVEVVSVLVNIADELLGVVVGVVLVTLALGAVADDALVALLVLVVGVVAATVVADLELVVGVVVALLRGAETVVADNLEVGAGRAVSLRSTVVTVADDDDIGGDGGDDLGDGSSDGCAVLSAGDGGSGGDGLEGLGDEVGVGDGVSLATRVHADGDVDGEKDVDVDLSAHDARARVEATTVLSIITRAGNVTLSSANSRRRGGVENAATVAGVAVQTEEVGAQAGFGTGLGVVLLVGERLSEAGEAILGGEAAEEVEAVRASDTTSGGGGGSSCARSSSTSLSEVERDGAGLSASSDGTGVGEAGGGELSSGHIAHGKGEDLGVTHLEV
jgi:hypothetical protein